MMQATQLSLSDYIAALKRQRGSMVGTFVAILLIGTAVTVMLPPVFRSTATILIEQQQIPEDLVRTTISGYADQKIKVISQRVMTRSNLLQIIQKFDLYPEMLKTEPMEVVVEKMRGAIDLGMVSAEVVDPRSGRPTQATIAFTLSYESISPNLAQQVTNELVSLYLNENLRSRAQLTSEASSFLNTEAAKLNQQINELEKQLAEFKQRNTTNLPEMGMLNQQLLERVENDLLETDRALYTVKDRIIFLSSELGRVSPESPGIGEHGERVLNSAERLRAIESRHVKLLALYSPGHPDVVRAQKELESLRNGSEIRGIGAELQKKLSMLQSDLAAAREKYSAEHPDVLRLQKEIGKTEAALMDRQSVAPSSVRDSEADNPLYVQFRAQLDSAQAEVQFLQTRRVELEAKRDQLTGRIAQAPQVEKNYLTLSRDHENASVKYRELKAKLMEAQLAQALETERKGERFELIEPPELPVKPIKPNRRLLFILAVMLAFSASFGLVFVRERLDTTVRGVTGVYAAAGVSPLVTIPYITIDQETKRQLNVRVMLFASVLLVLGGAVLAVHLLYSPIDVMWYAVLRRVGVAG